MINKIAYILFCALILMACVSIPLSGVFVGSRGDIHLDDVEASGVIEQEEDLCKNDHKNGSFIDTKEETPDKFWYTDKDAEDIAKLLHVECGYVNSQTEQACVVWTVLNRVDAFESNIQDVLRAPNQYAFRDDAPLRNDLLGLSYDVLDRWSFEKNGEKNVGRVLPREYLYFEGDGRHNYFRDAFKAPYKLWDYSLESPYLT